MRRVEEKCENLDADNNSDCEGPKAKKVKLMGSKPQPRVAFSGFRAEELKELVKKVKAIGGIVANSMHESTHLVTPGFKRTEKWYKAMHSGTFLTAPYSTVSFLVYSPWSAHRTAKLKSYKIPENSKKS